MWLINIIYTTLYPVHVINYNMGYGFNSTFNNISAISWRSVEFVEETESHGENHRTAGSHWRALSHNVVSSTHRHERDSKSQVEWW